MEYNKKLGEMIKFIAIRSSNDPRFGKTKLYKLIFFADFKAFKHLETSISGQGYHVENFGPVADDLEKTYREMIRSGEIGESRVEIVDHTIRRPVVLGEIDISVFSTNEILILEDIIQEFYLLNAKQISNASHDVIPAWEERLNGEPIPLSLSLIEPYEHTEEDDKELEEFADQVDRGVYEFYH